MKFRKKPVEIEACRWTGENVTEIFAFAKAHADVPALTVQDGNAVIRSSAGETRAEAGDWIIRGRHGTLSACRPDVFDATYDFVGEVQ